MSEPKREILTGCPLDLVKSFPAEHFHAVVTFPRPVTCNGLDDYARYAFASSEEGYWRAIMRVLRPGAFILAISDVKDLALHGMMLRMAKAEIRDKIDYHTAGPEALDYLDFRQYMVRLVSPPRDGIIFDPFCRDELTLKACELEGQGYIGIREETA